MSDGDRLALADEFSGEAKAHRTMGDHEEANKCEMAAAALRADRRDEPVAWTNEAQLGFLKDPQYAHIPMAMWADRGFIDDIPLYAHPQLAGAEREAVIEECAKACDDIEKAAEVRAAGLVSQSDAQNSVYDKAAAANTCARAIRALKEATPHSPVRGGGLEERTRMILQSTGMQATVQEAIMRHPHYSGSATSAYGFAGSALKAVLAALTGGDQ